MSEHKRAKARYWGLPVPPNLIHGNMSYAARIYGCNCKLCLPSGKRSWTNTEGRTGPKTPHERNRELRANKKGQPVPEGTKHGVYTYNVYNCRCAACKKAYALENERKRNAWRANSHGRWDTREEVDIICWPPKNADPDWVCPSCGSSPNQKEVA